jgi:hypothetical protein
MREDLKKSDEYNVELHRDVEAAPTFSVGILEHATRQLLPQFALLGTIVQQVSSTVPEFHLISADINHWAKIGDYLLTVMFHGPPSYVEFRAAESRRMLGLLALGLLTRAVPTSSTSMFSTICHLRTLLYLPPT